MGRGSHDLVTRPGHTTWLYDLVTRPGHTTWSHDLDPGMSGWDAQGVPAGHGIRALGLGVASAIPHRRSNRHTSKGVGEHTKTVQPS